MRDRSYHRFTSASDVCIAARGYLVAICMLAICIAVQCECRLERSAARRRKYKRSISWDLVTRACVRAEISITDTSRVYHNRSRFDACCPFRWRILLWLRISRAYPRNTLLSRTDAQPSSRSRGLDLSTFLFREMFAHRAGTRGASRHVARHRRPGRASPSSLIPSAHSERFCHQGSSSSLLDTSSIVRSRQSWRNTFTSDINNTREKENDSPFFPFVIKSFRRFNSRRYVAVSCLRIMIIIDITLRFIIFLSCAALCF